MSLMSSPVLLLVLLGLLEHCEAYFIGTPIQNRQGPNSICPRHKEQGRLYPYRHVPVLFSSMPSSTEELNTEIIRLCEAGEFEEAVASLEHLPPDIGLKSCYVQILKSLGDRQNQLQDERALAPKRTDTDIDNMVHLEQADKILQTLLELGGKPDSEFLLPDAELFNDLIKMWGSSTFAEKASEQCQFYLDSLWSLYDEQKDARFVPSLESYYHAISACSARDRSLDAVKRAESLMKDMESRSQDHPELKPNRSIANGVM